MILYDGNTMPVEKEFFPLITTEDLCEILSVPRKYIGLLRKHGIIPTRKYGRGYSITGKEYNEFIEMTAGCELENESDMISFAKAHKLKRRTV
jgi:hypothetical protein